MVMVYGNDESSRWVMMIGYVDSDDGDDGDRDGWKWWWEGDVLLLMEKIRGISRDWKTRLLVFMTVTVMVVIGG